MGRRFNAANGRTQRQLLAIAVPVLFGCSAHRHCLKTSSQDEAYDYEGACTSFYSNGSCENYAHVRGTAPVTHCDKSECDPGYVEQRDGSCVSQKDVDARQAEFQAIWDKEKVTPAEGPGHECEPGEGHYNNCIKPYRCEMAPGGGSSPVCHRDDYDHACVNAQLAELKAKPNSLPPEEHLGFAEAMCGCWGDKP